MSKPRKYWSKMDKQLERDLASLNISKPDKVGKTFSLLLKFWFVGVVVWLAAVIGIFWVVAHFIHKFW
jgi:hypothetical protein